MIARRVDELCACEAGAVALRQGDRSWTFGELAEAAHALAQQWTPFAGERVGVAVADLPRQLAALLAFDRLGASVVLFPSSRSATWVRQTAGELRLLDIVTDNAVSDVLDSTMPTTPQSSSTAKLGIDAGEIVLFTSGTSGPPQPVRHSWTSLAAAVNYSPEYRSRRWLLAYDPSSFAGIQVWLQSLLTGGALSIAPSGDSSAIVAALVRDGVQIASGTPTWWRMLLGATTPADRSTMTLEHITLGGEAVDQSLLDALHAAFPAAKIRHIYASTEMGVVLSVSDGMAGFPAALLNADQTHCRLRIAEDGQLQIRSARAMREFDPAAGWFSTGDLVEQRGDRVHFLGRKSGVINVGGSKVYPEDVERVIRLVPGVCEVRVSGHRSALVGELVCADVRPEEAIDQRQLEEAILAACRAQLPKYKVPALVRFSPTLATTDTGKLARQGSTTP